MNKNVLILAIVAFVIIIITVVFIVISGRKAKAESDAKQAELIAALGGNQAPSASSGGWGGAVNSAVQFGIGLYNQNQQTTKK